MHQRKWENDEPWKNFPTSTEFAKQTDAFSTLTFPVKFIFITNADRCLGGLTDACDDDAAIGRTDSRNFSKKNITQMTKVDGAVALLRQNFQLKWPENSTQLPET